MSEFTMSLREICAYYAGTSGLDPDYKKVIEDSREKLFDFDYPIFDEDYRPVLETKIIKHFFLREIGFDTVGMFKLRLDEKMNAIMPMYNLLYKNASMDFSPLNTVDMTTTNNGSRNATTTGTQNSTTNATTTDSSTASGSSDGLHKTADTPQSEVTDLLDGKYLTSASSDEGTSSSTSSSTGNTQSTANGTSSNTATSTDQYITRITGHNGRSAVSLIKEYRDNLIGVDKMIIEELNDLFMGLWV